MLRALQIVLAALLISEAHAEGSVLQNFSWITTTVPKKITPKPPEKTSPVIKVQDDAYCENGVGPCGGQCSEESGKKWECAATEIPCFHMSRCSCEAAAKCKPKKR
jgi:hypothetical protein